jgi:hypothetical protein
MRTDSVDIDPQNKKVKTDVGDLPLSPVMDPSYWEMTRQHQKKKPKPGKPVNSVEKQFRKSAFGEFNFVAFITKVVADTSKAHALATPIRQCAATRTRLPSFFLQDFNLVSHPETDNPWWIPRSLEWDEPAKSQEDSELGDEIPTGEDASCDGSEARMPSAAQPDRPAKGGPRAYLLARRDLVSAIGEQGLGYQKTHLNLYGLMNPAFAKFGRQAVWRQGMDSVVLDRMRQNIIKDLTYLGRLCAEDKRHYIAKCYGWDDVQYKHQGAVLWFDGTPKSDGTNKLEDAPGLLATYDVAHFEPDVDATATLAVHNMPLLLGAENAAKLKQEVTFSDGSLFMLAGRRTTHVQQQLWRLQGYLADY